MKTLIWTRSVDDWESDFKLLLGLLPSEIPVVHFPCIRLAAIDRIELNSSAWTHAIFTSPHAVAFAMQDPLLAKALGQCKEIYTHGEATAAKLKSLGLTPTLIEGIRKGEELATVLAQKIPAGANIIVPGPKEPAFDMSGFLNSKGFKSQALICYETKASIHKPDGSHLSSQEVLDLQKSPNHVICFASPSAVQGFSGKIPHTLARVVVLGPTTREKAKSLSDLVFMASHNRLESLIEKAKELLFSA